MSKNRQKPIPEHAKVVFRGKIFDVINWEQKMYDGSTMTFERLRRPDTTQVVAVVGDKILIQQQQQPDSEPFLSLPGGRSEPGEEPLEAAKRELLEETGYASDDWILWKEDRPVNKMDWTIYTYVARNCKKVADASPDSGELLTPHLISFDEFLMLSDHELFRDLELVTELLRARLAEEKAREMKALFFK